MKHTRQKVLGTLSFDLRGGKKPIYQARIEEVWIVQILCFNNIPMFSPGCDMMWTEE
jgi:hypothetical protein